MGRSQQTFNKTEKVKKRLKKKEEKRKKMAARKAEAKESGKKGIEFAYVDHNGNLTDTPPDPSQKVKYEAESIEISIPKTLESDKEEIDPIRKGKVSFFNSSKGFGFIIDAENNEKYFTHISGIIDDIDENDKVTFELEQGKKGLNAVNVTLIKE
ncbi:cold shock protein CspC [Kordia sp. SMS9]|uniref:cold-shock protein n=1 Tax=Kordia sp. SMS9 TaxID=2282170 RepID=UPI000E0D0F1D|nr:cold shock domain-containing protein [Kordia sp. SMS9]AXG71289.1 cold shock protein CspC [Kordia sp. SMS9]